MYFCSLGFNCFSHKDFLVWWIICFVCLNKFKRLLYATCAASLVSGSSSRCLEYFCPQKTKTNHVPPNSKTHFKCEQILKCLADVFPSGSRVEDRGGGVGGWILWSTASRVMSVYYNYNIFAWCRVRPLVEALWLWFLILRVWESISVYLELTNKTNCSKGMFSPFAVTILPVAASQFRSEDGSLTRCFLYSRKEMIRADSITKIEKDPFFHSR